MSVRHEMYKPGHLLVRKSEVELEVTFSVVSNASNYFFSRANFSTCTYICSYVCGRKMNNSTEFFLKIEKLLSSYYYYYYYHLLLFLPSHQSRVHIL